MKPNNIIIYVFKSIVAGLAIAFVLIMFIPSLINNNTSSSKTFSNNNQQSEFNSYADAVEVSAPAVVNISTQTIVTDRKHRMSNDPFMQHLFDQLFGGPRQRLEKSLGSGVIVDKAGIILTNYHVIKNAQQIEVALKDGRITLATIIGVDPDTDIAVLKITLDELPSIQLSNASHYRVGDIVLAIGNPFGVGQTVTSGIISGTGRNMLGINTFEDFIQTDAAINPGNSGGALINSSGELIGINTAIITRSGGSQGIGLAIPIKLAKNVMRQIIDQGYVTRGWIGIAVQELTAKRISSMNLPMTEGVIITSILRKGPAKIAGVQIRDVILKINNVDINNRRLALNEISKAKPGELISLTIYRDNKNIKFSVRADQRPPNS